MDQLRCLRVFVRVVTGGSFAGAARTLDLAPAVVTRAVAELEQHVGARLLNRTTRRLALTEIGEAYFDQARRILAELDDADAMAGASAQQPCGLVKVLCPPAFAVHQLARHLPRFRAAFPRLELEISATGEAASPDPSHDVAIVSVVQRPLDGDFIARRLARSDFILCAAPDYLRRHGVPEHPDDLLQHDGVLPAVSSVRRELELTRCGSGSATQGRAVVTIPTPQAALSTAQLDLMLAAATAGLGIAGLPTFVAHDALVDGRLQRVLPHWQGASLTLYATMPARRHLPARSRVFIDFLCDTFGGADHDPWLEPAQRATTAPTPGPAP